MHNKLIMGCWCGFKKCCKRGDNRADNVEFIRSRNFDNNFVRLETFEYKPNVISSNSHRADKVKRQPIAGQYQPTIDGSVAFISSRNIEPKFDRVQTLNSKHNVISSYSHRADKVKRQPTAGQYQPTIQGVHGFPNVHIEG